MELFHALVDACHLLFGSQFRGPSGQSGDARKLNNAVIFVAGVIAVLIIVSLGLIVWKLV